MTHDERRQAIKAGFDGKKDADIRAAAEKVGIVFKHDDNRDEKLEKLASKIIADEDAANEAADREAREAAERKAKEVADRKAAPADGEMHEADIPARDRSIRSVNAAFIKDLPRAVRSGGVHTVDPDSPEAGEHRVPDGRYRVSGSDYVLEFRDGKWAGAVLANPRGEPDYTEIPDSEGGSVGSSEHARASF